MSRTVAVTGASGFIGRYLCPALEAAGYQVLRLGRGNAVEPDERQTDYSQDSLTRALEGADAVVHLAGRRMTREDAPMDVVPFWSSNVAGIADLVAAAQTLGVERIVLASTIAIYAPASGLPYRECAPARPINAYALSKLMAEAHLEMLTRKAGLSSVALRFAAVYGHGEKGTPALMKFINQALAGETITLTGNADYRIDQLYVRDAVSAIMAALSSEAEGIYNIGGGRALAVGEIAETVNDVFGNDGNILYATDSDQPMPETMMALDRAILDLGWQPAFDLKAGLEDFRRTRDADLRSDTD